MADVPVTRNAPFVVRDSGIIAWGSNVVHAASASMNYGFAVIDGAVFALRQDGDRMFLSFVDGGAHMARHIYNSLRSVHSEYESRIGTLFNALAHGRSYSASFLPSLRLPDEMVLTFQGYHDIVCKLMEANFGAGFGISNYVRPLYGVDGIRTDGTSIDFAIDPKPLNPLFTFMPEHWGKLLVPRMPEFEGLNVLLVRSSRSPAPDTSHIQFKAASSYGPTRGSAVNERDTFNRLIGPSIGVVAHDILLLDHTLQYVRELSGANVSAYIPSEDHGVVLTPPLDTSIFPGLTRDFIINQVLRGEVGNAFGISVVENARMSVETLVSISRRGGELGGMGSALGYIPIKRVIVPRVPYPQTKDDYQVIDFKTGPKTFGAMLQSTYGCFSVGDGFRVSTPRGDVESTSMVSWPLLFEIPRELHDQARHHFMRVGGKSYDHPLDQIMRSSMVTPLKRDNVRVVPFRLLRMALAANPYPL